MKSTDVKISTSPAIVGNNVLPAVKELACWIYYEDGSTFYCFDCVENEWTKSIKTGSLLMI